MTLPIHVSTLVGDIPPVDITVRTLGAPTLNQFHESVRSTSDATVSAVVHPSGRRTLERLGIDFNRALISVYTLTEIPLTAEIQHNGRWYVAIDSGDYAALGGIYLTHAELRQETSA